MEERKESAPVSSKTTDVGQKKDENPIFLLTLFVLFSSVVFTLDIASWLGIRFVHWGLLEIQKIYSILGFCTIVFFIFYFVLNRLVANTKFRYFLMVVVIVNTGYFLFVKYEIGNHMYSSQIVPTRDVFYIGEIPAFNIKPDNDTDVFISPLSISVSLIDESGVVAVADVEAPASTSNCVAVLLHFRCHADSYYAPLGKNWFFTPLSKTGHYEVIADDENLRGATFQVLEIPVLEFFPSHVGPYAISERGVETAFFNTPEYQKIEWRGKYLTGIEDSNYTVAVAVVSYASALEAERVLEEDRNLGKKEYFGNTVFVDMFYDKVKGVLWVFENKIISLYGLTSGIPDDFLQKYLELFPSSMSNLKSNPL